MKRYYGIKFLSKSFIGVIIFCCVCYISSLSNAFGQDALPRGTTDTISNPESYKETTLAEVTIEGRTQRVIADGVEYIPEEKIKKGSVDAFSLIRNMQLPSITIDSNNKITTQTGDNIAVFINNQLASKSQLEGLKTENIIRVELLTSPSDIRFRGYEHVINIIIKRYEYGGYTSLKLIGETPIYNKAGGSVFSEFAYKRITFSLWAGARGGYSNELGNSGEEIFHNLTYNGVKYDVVSKKIVNGANNSEKNNNEWAGIYTSYQSSKFYCDHTLGLTNDDLPRRDRHFTLNFIPEIIRDSEARDLYTSKTLSPYMNGYYYFDINDKNKLNAFITYTYANTEISRTYNIGDFDKFLNKSKEKTHTFDISAIYQYLFSLYHAFEAQASSINNFFDTNYNGSYEGIQKIITSENLLNLAYIFNRNRFSLSCRLGLSLLRFSLNSDIHSTQWNPRIYIMSGYQFNDKNRLNIQLAMGNNSQDPASESQAVVRKSELIWRTGTPRLKTILFSMAELNYNFIPTNNFSLSFSTRYDGYHRMTINDYIPAPYLNGLLEKPITDGKYLRFQANLGVNLKLINRSLLLGGKVSSIYDTYRGSTYNISKFNVRGEVSASYYIKNINIGIYYKSPQKYLNASNLSKYSIADNYGLSIGYSIKSFKLGLEFKNWFRAKSDILEEFKSPLYAYDLRTIDINGGLRSIKVSLSYVIDYGRKLRHNNFGKENYDGKSAIVK